MTGRRWTLVRWTFLVAVVAGAWWSWRASGEELSDALADVSAGRVVVSGVFVVAGLVLTSAVWLVSLGSFDAMPGPHGGAVPSFFVAQLGKYIPGSVWSFAAQGMMGAARGLPARATAAAAILFLGVHVSSGLTAVGLVGWWTTLPRPVVGVALVVGVAGLTPAVYRALGTRLAGAQCDWSIGHSVRGALVMCPAWCCYTISLTALAPSADASAALGLGCAFALAFAVGVAFPIAPAGLGARDGALIVLITPVIGAGPAGAVAVLSRLLHTLADFLLAGLSWCMMRASSRPQASDQRRDHH